MTENRPKAWIDEKTFVTMFRGDVTKDEARELNEMLRQAFKAGMKNVLDQQLHPRSTG